MTEEQKEYSPSVARVASALRDGGVDSEIRLTTSSARTAQEAADTLGVALGQIAKSLVFRRKDTEEAVLVIAAGDRRVDELKVARLLGASIGRADANFVREKTGFAIGGVAPLAHLAPLTILGDVSLLRFELVWAAAGTPHAVFPIAPAKLFELTGALVGEMVEAQAGG